MILSDQDIVHAIAQGRLAIDPFNTDDLQPASIDLHLGDKAKTPKTFLTGDSRGVRGRPLRASEPMEYIEYPVGDGLWLKPQCLVLATTIERVRLSAGLVARLEGKSSLGRRGIIIHVTAGFFDPGFNGEATLELYNFLSFPQILEPGMKIAQMSFHELKNPAKRIYGDPALGSKYQHQSGPTESKLHENFEEEK